MLQVLLCKHGSQQSTLTAEERGLLQKDSQVQLENARYSFAAHFGPAEHSRPGTVVLTQLLQPGITPKAGADLSDAESHMKVDSYTV